MPSHVLKGFVTHSLFANNTPGVVSEIGEISTKSLTYSREKGSYTSDSISPDLTLISFLSLMISDDPVPARTAVEIPLAIKNHTLEVSKFIYSASLNSGSTLFADELLQSLTVAFTGKAQNFASGEIVVSSAQGHSIPEWISWDFVPASGTRSQIRLWFVDSRFQAQYDETQIIIVPPLARLDDFFKSAAEVEALLKARTLPEMIEQIQIAKENYPETIIRMESFAYLDPFNPSHQLLSQWGLLIYGEKGNNIDSIKDALVDYVLTHSSHTRAQWTALLPDLFRRTEFLIIPRWAHYAIPNRTLEAGIYLQVTPLSRAIQRVKDVAVDYPLTHIDEHAYVMGHPYKSIALLSIGSPENRDNLYELVDVFPDYIDVSSTSIDFNRMSQKTQDWLLFLEQMVVIAETMNDYTPIPAGMTKVRRNGNLYIVKNFENIHYLVYAKSNIVM